MVVWGFHYPRCISGLPDPLHHIHIYPKLLHLPVLLCIWKRSPWALATGAMRWKEDTWHHSINTTSSQATSSNGFPTTRHHVETAQLRFSGDDDDSDSEVVANPNTINHNSNLLRKHCASLPFYIRLLIYSTEDKTKLHSYLVVFCSIYRVPIVHLFFPQYMQHI